MLSWSSWSRRLSSDHLKFKFRLKIGEIVFEMIQFVENNLALHITHHLVSIFNKKICLKFFIFFKLKFYVRFIERGSERRKSDHRKIRTSKVFVRMIRTLKDQNVKNLKRIRTSKVKLDFQRSDFTYGVRKNQNVKNWKEQLPMAYCLCVPRPVGVRLGSIRLGWVRLGWVRLG